MARLINYPKMWPPPPSDGKTRFLYVDDFDTFVKQLPDGTILHNELRIDRWDPDWSWIEVDDIEDPEHVYYVGIEVDIWD